jgi:hypothetical protein
MLGQPSTAARRGVRLHASTWAYAALAASFVVLGVVPTAPPALVRLFGETVVADLFVNLATPFIVIGAGLVTALVAGRDRARPLAVWPVALVLAVVFVVVPLMVVRDAGGWLLLVTAVLLFLRAGWLFHRSGDALDVANLLGRGLVAPWLFMLPALGLSCLVVGRNDLTFADPDWVPCFGFVYFALQAVFEEAMLRRVADWRGEVAATPGVTADAAA